MAINWKSKRAGIIALVVLLLTGVLVYLTYSFPHSGYGQEHLQGKAQQTFGPAFADMNEIFTGQPEAKPAFTNKFCNELRGRELDAGEAEWIQECSSLKITTYALKDMNNAPKTLQRLDDVIKQAGWSNEFDKLPSELNTTKPDSSYYYLKGQRTRCYLSTSYDQANVDVPPDTGTTFTLYQSCSYYYRSILDL